MAETNNDAQELARLRTAWAKEHEELSQLIGKALGYPYYKDLPEFPEATGQDGVCTFHLVLPDLVDEIVEKYTDLKPDSVKSARTLALKKHGNQPYGDDTYDVHLDAVAEVVKPYGPVAQKVAYLHDTREDTDLTDDQINSQFGEIVAGCVDLCTDPKGANRKERKVAANAKLAAVPHNHKFILALVVKPADRLVNLRKSVLENNIDKMKMYLDEHDDFAKAAYRSGLCDGIWAEITVLIDTIRQRLKS